MFKPAGKADPGEDRVGTDMLFSHGPWPPNHGVRRVCLLWMEGRLEPESCFVEDADAD